MNEPRMAHNSTHLEKPTIVLVLPRGEAVRNFVYSDTLKALAEDAKVAVLSVVHDEEIAELVRPFGQLVPLTESPISRSQALVRTLVENAHDRRLWSRAGQNNWELRDLRARESGRTGRRLFTKAMARLLASETALRALTALENRLTLARTQTSDLDRLFADLDPSLVFNGSHIHGFAGELPLKVAHKRGTTTSGFVFSWDNLTSRSRIFVPYDHYLVWTEGMRSQLLSIYPFVTPACVHVTGTPQFDFHTKEDLVLSRDELARRIGIDPNREFVLWTTGINNHFYDEHLHVETVIQHLAAIPESERPQLVVRTYVKGTGEAMKALAASGHPDVVFPPVLWNAEWQTPRPDDLLIYSNLLRHCAVGINAASTVSLELMLFDKPVINLGFDPPSSNLPWCKGYERHILLDHYEPVAESGAVMVAKSNQELCAFVDSALAEPDRQAPARQRFLTEMFGSKPSGNAGERVAEVLLRLATDSSR